MPKPDRCYGPKQVFPQYLLSVPCKYCKAPIGQYCVSKATGKSWTKIVQVHNARINALRGKKQKLAKQGYASMPLLKTKSRVLSSTLTRIYSSQDLLTYGRRFVILVQLPILAKQLCISLHIPDPYKKKQNDFYHRRGRH